MYSYTARVRYSETDMSGRLTEIALLDYLQDTAIFHSEDIGYGVKYMSENNIAWVLGSWQIDVGELPEIGESITVETYPYRFRGFIGCRAFIIKSLDGEREYARANSVWSLINTDTMKPAVVPQEMIEAYRPDDIDIGSSGKKLRPDKDAECIGMDDIAITLHHIDTNNHVNNAKYIHMASEYIPVIYGDNKRIVRIRAEYKKQVYLGNVLSPKVYINNNIILVVFEDEDKKTAVNIEFMAADRVM